MRQCQSNFSQIYKHQWCSGNISAFQALALGSIPGWCKNNLLLLLLTASPICYLCNTTCLHFITFGPTLPTLSATTQHILVFYIAHPFVLFQTLHLNLVRLSTQYYAMPLVLTLWVTIASNKPRNISISKYFGARCFVSIKEDPNHRCHFPVAPSQSAHELNMQLALTANLMDVVSKGTSSCP